MARTKPRVLAARKPTLPKRKQPHDDAPYDNHVQPPKKRRASDENSIPYSLRSRRGNTSKRKFSQDPITSSHDDHSRNQPKRAKTERDFTPIPLTVDALSRFEASSSPHPHRNLSPLAIDYFSDTGYTHWSIETDDIPEWAGKDWFLRDRAKKRVKMGKTGREISYRPWDPVSEGLPPADYLRNMPETEKKFWTGVCNTHRKNPGTVMKQEWYWDAKAGQSRRRIAVTHDFGRALEGTEWYPRGVSNVRAQRQYPASPGFQDFAIDMMTEDEYERHRLRIEGFYKEAESEPAPPAPKNVLHYMHFPPPSKLEHVDQITAHQMNRRVVDGLLELFDSIEIDAQPLGPVAQARKKAEDEWLRWNRRRPQWV